MINPIECFFDIEDHVALEIRDRDTIPYSCD